MGSCFRNPLIMKWRIYFFLTGILLLYGDKVLFTMEIQHKIDERVQLGYNQHITVAHVSKEKTEFFHAGKFTFPSEQAIFEIGSVTKLFTAHLALILCREGVLSLDVPIQQYLPEINKTFTLRQVLTHTSGLSDPFTENYLHSETGNTVVIAEYSVADLYDHINSTPLSHVSGTKILYSNCAYGLVGHLLEKVTDKNYFDLLQEKIFKSAKMTRTFLEVSSAFLKEKMTGSESGSHRPEWKIPHLPAFGGLKSTAKDLASYLKFCFLDLQANHEDVELLTAPFLEWDKAPITATLGWTIDRRYGGEFYAATGQTLGCSCFMGFSTQTQEGIVLLTDASMLDCLGHFWLNTNFPLQPLYATLPMTFEELQVFEGTYRHEEILCRINARDGYLEMQVLKEPLLRLYPMGGGLFFSKYLHPSHFPISFTANKNQQKTFIMRDKEKEYLFLEVNI